MGADWDILKLQKISTRFNMALENVFTECTRSVHKK